LLFNPASIAILATSFINIKISYGVKNNTGNRTSCVATLIEMQTVMRVLASKGIAYQTKPIEPVVEQIERTSSQRYYRLMTSENFSENKKSCTNISLTW